MTNTHDGGSVPVVTRAAIIAAVVFLSAVHSVCAADYFIYDWHDLQGMKDHLGDNCYLMNDLGPDTPGFAAYQDGEGFEPIGDRSGPWTYTACAFTGLFDGRGHTIRGLYINRPAAGEVGLFGATRGAMIQNVGLIDANITGGHTAGALIGFFGDHYAYRVRLRNCYSTGKVVATCATTTTDHYGAGGLVGYMYDVRISDCYSSADVTGVEYAGGLVGRGSFSRIMQCYASGDVAASEDLAGGIIGSINSHGSPGPYDAHVDNSFACGVVTCPGENVGGLVGETIGPYVYFNNSYFIDDHRNGHGSYEPAGAAVFQMAAHAVYATWDFEGIWSIDDGNCLPWLFPDPVPDRMNNLVLHYTFDENDGAGVTDQSEYDNNGVIHGATRQSVGPGHGVMVFDGVDDFVDVADSDSLDVTDQTTISVWVKPTLANTHRIVCKWGKAGYRAYNVDVEWNGKPTFHISYDGSDSPCIKPFVGPVAAGEWHHVVAVYSKGEAFDLYVDGEKQSVLLGGSPLQDAPIKAMDTPLRLGRNYNDYDVPYYFGGEMDEVRIYNVALSETEIAELYENDAWRKDGIPPGSTNSLVLCYPFNEAETGTVTDYSVYGNDGTPVGTSWLGEDGGVCVLNGIDDEIKVDDTDSLDMTDQLTVSAWIKADLAQLGSDYDYVSIVDKTLGAAGQNKGFAVHLHNRYPRSNSIVLAVATESGTKRVARVDGAIQDEDWHYVACVYDNRDPDRKARIYIDGVERAVDSDALGTGNMVNNNLELRVGRSNDGKPSFAGLLDEVRIYNVALSAADVEAKYVEDAWRRGHTIVGSMNVNPNASPQSEFRLTLSDGTVITRDDLHEGFGGYTGPAIAVRVKPAGDGLQNSLTIDGEPYRVVNADTYLISSDMMTVTLRNDQGGAMGHWVIDIDAVAATFTCNAADRDLDGMSDRDELTAGTSPTDAADIFCVNAVVVGTPSSGALQSMVLLSDGGSSDQQTLTLSCQAHAGRTYFLHVRANLTDDAEWEVVRTLPGVDGLLVFEDVPMESGQAFYRISVAEDQ
jgi:hypothetical protein